jgi:hypothetical protein
VETSFATPRHSSATRNTPDTAERSTRYEHLKKKTNTAHSPSPVPEPELRKSQASVVSHHGGDEDQRAMSGLHATDVRSVLSRPDETRGAE